PGAVGGGSVAVRGAAVPRWLASPTRPGPPGVAERKWVDGPRGTRGRCGVVPGLPSDLRRRRAHRVVGGQPGWGRPGRSVVHGPPAAAVDDGRLSARRDRPLSLLPDGLRRACGNNPRTRRRLRAIGEEEPDLVGRRLGSLGDPVPPGLCQGALHHGLPTRAGVVRKGTPRTRLSGRRGTPAVSH